MPDIHKLRGRRPSSREKAWQRETRSCQECGAEYSPIRQNQKFCTQSCRRAWYRNQNRWTPDPETVEREDVLLWLGDYLRRCRCLEGEAEITLRL